MTIPVGRPVSQQSLASHGATYMDRCRVTSPE